ncbi:helix-turn-helix transcriptional regulator [Tsukamurella sp. 8F]|uniref:helix-turn-helix domain-containing protein n=1 Tax=unclassified Tsukamurella TaxID=2633480 RepID=UPI0023B9789D|nr:MULTISPECIES: helix-turn-helix transcriptional regulator [unclassified Tsukamurella]MDF0531494.1 helix-turn-helix transcriptional regulator [Tsukamurella sp. 8J]MDF0588738.1 helix-turn-helix transcriptional regulator [Tsukamurella sp. 8F]
MAAAVTKIRDQDQPAGGQAPARPLLREVYGRVLRQERTRQGRTLTEVAREAGVSTQYLSEIERGRKEPSSEVLGSVCDALGGSLLEFVGGVHRELLGTRAKPVALAAA